MRLLFAKKFRKQYAKLQPRVRLRADDRLRVFVRDSFDPILDNHSLHGKYDGCRSINITGDYRAIYYHEAEDIVHFLAIGTHPEMYGK